MKDKVILGAGGMAREVYQIYRDLGQDEDIKGFVINSGSVQKDILPKPVFTESSILNNKTTHILINGIGSPLRKKWITQLDKDKFKFDTVIHPSVLVGKKILFGKDLIINANCVLTCNITIGDHVIINVNVTIAHDCDIDNFVTISPVVNIGGGVRIGEASFIGIGASIIQKITIGKNTIVGAGSVVVDHVPDNSLVFGNPAKIIRKIQNKDIENLF